MTLSLEEAEAFVYHHVFLPPKLPQDDDTKASNDYKILEEVIGTVRSWPIEGNIGHYNSWAMVRKAADVICDIHRFEGEHVVVGQDELHNVIHQALSSDSPVDIPIYVHTQNAGLLVSYRNNVFNFQPFELSASNANIYSTNGRLKQNFPGISIDVSKETLNSDGMAFTISNLLSTLSSELTPGMTPRVRKAGQDIAETREPSMPTMITKFFSSFLLTFGEPRAIDGIQKNVRDEVVHGGHLLPWRRSPWWLFLRVTLQTVIYREFGALGREVYKLFMLLLMKRFMERHLYDKSNLDEVSCMAFKISHRLHKINAAGYKTFPVISNAVGLGLEKASKTLNSWKRELELADTQQTDLDEVKYSLKDIDYEIPISHNTLHSILNYRSTALKDSDAGVRDKVSIECPSDLPLANLFDSEDKKDFNLRLFESWMETSSFKVWNISLNFQFERLLELFHEYWKSSQAYYSHDPVGLSRSILVILELWIHCDVSAIDKCNLLPSYRPEFDTALLHSLVLESKLDFERLEAVEMYIKERNAPRGKSFSFDFVIGNETSPENLSVKMFDLDPAYTKVHQDIVAESSKRRDTKMSELRGLQDEFHRFMSLSESHVCEFIDHEVYTVDGLLMNTKVHSLSCARCSYKRKAENLRIKVEEDILPIDRIMQKAIVVELNPPVYLCIWRDMTYYVQRYILSDTNPVRYPSYCHIHKYKPLQRWAGMDMDSKTKSIILSSTTKPHIFTHRRGVALSTAKLNDVFVRNGLDLQYYDCRKSSFCRASNISTPNPNLIDKMQFQMPVKSQVLQKFCRRSKSEPSGVNPNMAISELSACPLHLTMAEFKALSSMGLGYHLHWPNILLQLTAPVVDFNKPETRIMVFQCLYHTGAPSDISKRAPHESVDETLALNILAAIDKATNRIEKNWACTVSMSIYVAIVTRLTAIVSNGVFFSTASVWLHRCRTIVRTWISILQERAKTANVDGDIEIRLAECIAIAADTFNLDKELLEKVLSKSQNIVDYAEINIASAEMQVPSESRIQKILTRRWLDTRLRALEIASRALQYDISLLARAIRRQWSSFAASNQQWSVYSRYIQLFTCDLNSDCGGGAVVFNLLTGSLTIDGHPLRTIPWSLRNHPTYLRLFKHSIFDVCPSPDPNFDLMSRQPIFGHDVHFGLEPRERQLALRIVNADQNKLDLLPDSLFAPHLPENLVAGHTFWYNHRTRVIEIRRDSDVWNPASGYWKIQMTSTGEWQMTFRDKTGMMRKLIPMTSPAFGVFSRVFRRLECNKKQIQITAIANEQYSNLDVELLRRNLSFYIDKRSGAINSRQFRGMIVPYKVNIGTLCGLYNKLILQDNTNKFKQKVLVLGNSPLIVNQRQIVSQATEQTADVPAKVYVYDVDDCLGRLVDNGSLGDKLFLAYIHARTSISACTDSLTELSGTEQAIEILTSAAVQSTTVISKEAADILQKIYNLAPKRRFYPEHLRVMQMVDWDENMSCFVQDDLLSVLISRLACRAKELDFLFPQMHPPSIEDTSVLVKRAVVRSKSFRSSGMLSTPNVPDDEDTEFKPRVTLDSGLFTRLLQNMHAARHGGIVSSKHNAEKMGNTLWNIFRTINVKSSSLMSMYSVVVDYRKTLLLESTTVFESFISLHKVLSARKYSALRPIFLPQFVLWIGTLSLSQGVSESVLQCFICLWHSRDISFESPPHCSGDYFQLSLGILPNQATLESRIMSKALPTHRCPAPEASSLGVSDDDDDYQELVIDRVRSTQSTICHQIIKEVMRRWPCSKPVILSCHGWQRYFDNSNLEPLIQAAFQDWFENLKFRNYLSSLASSWVQWKDLPGYNSHPPAPRSAPVYVRRYSAPPARQKTGELDDQLFCDVLPLCSKYDFDENTTPQHLSSLKNGSVDELSTREKVMAAFVERLDKMASTDHHREYIDDLRSSISSMCNMASSSSSLSETDHAIYLSLHRPRWRSSGANVLQDELLSCQSNMALVFSMLADSYRTQQKSLGFSFSHDLFLYRFRPAFFLRRLSRQYCQQLPDAWKSAIVQYGIFLTKFQRLSRVSELYTRDQHAALAELSNPGHTNWNPLRYPDSLLLEIDANIMIRSVQQDVATLMECPPDGLNCVTQLNMGEGKSSVIVPIVSSALADGSRLVCVLVGKPHAPQMLETLCGKLGGLVNRRIFQLPFVRGIAMSTSYAEGIVTMLKDCQETGGILLVQPEHLLSLKLAGIEAKLSKKRQDISSVVVSIQNYMDANSRFIVDESDENFSTKFELVYTIGVQLPIEGTPQRWQTLHQVLDRVPEIARQTQNVFPSSVEIGHDWPGCFPRIRVLREDAMKMLLKLLATNICEYGLLGLPISRQPANIRSSIVQYILNFNVPKSITDEVEQNTPTTIWSSENRKTLLLLRGLIACGVLTFGLTKKRWRVDYGLDDSRLPPTRLAVPYRAKDSPSVRAEFSHPDGVMMLTSLSYYYGGLSDAQLFEAFNHLLLNGQAEMEYSTWTRSLPKLPASFRHLSGINLLDNEQCVNEIFPCLRHSKAVIDYFLSHIVFPKEMREFPQRISASGWDLAEIKPNATTGFSGTNDAKVLLPIDIQQYDRQSLKGTNALVLSHLLKSQQSSRQAQVYRIPKARAPDTRSDAIILLSLVKDISPPVRVIIDVGAQILELNNEGVAKEWLAIMPPDPSLEAVVFFNDNDELCVVDRKGNIEPLQTSHFAHQLDLCLVFLDEAHSRGTDLKLPPGYRAAVTLGSGLTKDRLTQACMRMRKLGYTQTVSFCVPDEISNKIKAVIPGQSPTSPITVSDILLWSIHETWEYTSGNIPLWGHQGIRHRRSKKLWERARKKNVGITTEFAQRFLEPEAQTLEKRYRPRYHTADDDHFLALEGFTLPKEDAIFVHAQKFIGMGPKYALLGEEQERELAPEIEVERQSQRPLPVTCRTPKLDPRLAEFVQTGILRSDAKVMRAFESLRNTSALKNMPHSLIPGNLLVTETFASPVQHSEADDSIPRSRITFNHDSYLQPVQWLLVANTYAESNPIIIIISPFEAQELFQQISKSAYVSMHMYGPRINEMFPALDNLNLYIVAGNNNLTHSYTCYYSLVLQLNLFAGQLYFSNLGEYHDMCNLLGLAKRLPTDDEIVAADGFFLRDAKGRLGGKSGFLQSPVEMVRRLMHIRHEQASIERTHVGSMLDNRFLSQEQICEDMVSINLRTYSFKQKARPAVRNYKENGTVGMYEMAPEGLEFNAKLRAQMAALQKTTSHADILAEITRLMKNLGYAGSDDSDKAEEEANDKVPGETAQKKKKRRKNKKKKGGLKEHIV